MEKIIYSKWTALIVDLLNLLVLFWVLFGEPAMIYKIFCIIYWGFRAYTLFVSNENEELSDKIIKKQSELINKEYGGTN